MEGGVRMVVLVRSKGSFLGKCWVPSRCLGQEGRTLRR